MMDGLTIKLIITVGFVITLALIAVFSGYSFEIGKLRFYKNEEE